MRADGASPDGGRESPFASFGRKVDAQVGEIGPRIEEEVRRVIDYLNDQVVPQVRRHSSSALRVAAERLGQLAEHLDERRRPSSVPPAGPGRPPAEGGDHPGA